jgi:hypothetical protein
MVQDHGLGPFRGRLGEIVDIDLHLSQQDRKHAAFIVDARRSRAPQYLEFPLDGNLGPPKVNNVYSGRVVGQQMVALWRGAELYAFAART